MIGYLTLAMALSALAASVAHLTGTPPLATLGLYASVGLVSMSLLSWRSVLAAFRTHRI